MRPLTALAVLLALAAVAFADSLGNKIKSRLRAPSVTWCLTSADQNNFACYLGSSPVHCSASYPLCKGAWETRSSPPVYLVACAPLSAVSNPGSVSLCTE